MGHFIKAVPEGGPWRFAQMGLRSRLGNEASRESTAAAPAERGHGAHRRTTFRGAAKAATSHPDSFLYLGSHTEIHPVL